MNLFCLRIIVYLVVYNSGQVVLEHLHLSWYPSQRGPTSVIRLKKVDAEAGPPEGAGVPRSKDYRGASLKRNRTPLGPYSRPMCRALWCS